MTETTERPVGTNMTAAHRNQEILRQREESRKQLTEAQMEWARNWKMPTNVNAGEEHTLLCQWCMRPFKSVVKRSGMFRDSIEYEPLRKILLVTDPNWMPPICDTCFPSIMGSVRSDDNRTDRPDEITNFPLRTSHVNTNSKENVNA